jgi:transcriptional regulator with XRE-family HTH domain
MEPKDALQAVEDGRARAFRLAIGDTQRRAGARIGVGPLTVYGWESGRRRPHPAVAKVYLEALLAKMAEDGR